MTEQRPDRKELDALIREIGICRFFGRVNSGIIEPEAGMQTIEYYVREQEAPPKGLVNRILYALTA